MPAALIKALGAKPGTWSQAFGKDADEFFHAWSVAKFIGDVAAAGKKEYPLPMYVNAALRDPFHPGAPGGYASGGPTDNVISIYRAAAPAIDIVAPDIYMKESTKVVSRDRALQAGRSAAGAGDRQRPAVRALFLRRARRAGHRHRAVRHRLHRLFELPAGREECRRSHRRVRAAVSVVGTHGARVGAPELHEKVWGASEPDDRSSRTLDLGRWRPR